MSDNTEWKQCSSTMFWGDIAANDHVVQLYDNDSLLIQTLADFAADGFATGEAVIVIATALHLNALNEQLISRGFSLLELINDDRFMTLDADQTLASFMVNGAPDEKYFMETVVPLMKRAKKGGRQVRAFGEMVVLLWQRGNISATMELEHLWNKFGAVESFNLLCAYPKAEFNNDAGASVMHICTAHSKQIRSTEDLPGQIQYKEVV